MNEFFVVFLIISISLAIISGSLIGIRAINVNFFDNIPSKVYVDDKLVYEGISAGFRVSSGGYTTTVRTYGGFLYMFPKKVYVSKNVVVVGEK